MGRHSKNKQCEKIARFSLPEESKATKLVRFAFTSILFIFLPLSVLGQTSPPSSFVDNFDQPTLNSAWQLHPGLGDISLTANPGFLRYTLGAPQFTKAVSDDNSLWVFRQFSGDSWTLETKVTYSLSPSENGRQMYMRIPFPDTSGRNVNEIRWYRDIDCCGPRNHIVVDFNDNGQLTTVADFPPNAADTYVVRVIRKQQSIDVQVSPDGTAFSSVAKFTFRTTLPSLQDVALSSTNFCCGGYADFDYFKVSSICPVTLSFGLAPLNYQYAVASFTPPSGTVPGYASACGYDHFNWTNRVTHEPPAAAGSTIVPWNPGPLIASGNVAYLGLLLSPLDTLHCASVFDWTGCSLVAPPIYSDPPNGSYTYLGTSYNPYPYYLPSDSVKLPGACPFLDSCPPFPYALSFDLTTLSFVDAPAERQLSGEKPSPNPSGNFIAFSTALVGVDSQGTAHDLPGGSFTWNSTFNGTAGGVSQTASIYPIDPGSGTGGVTITSINGEQQAPPTVSCSETPTTIWPREDEDRDKPFTVTVSGTVTAGTQTIPTNGITFAITNEFGRVRSSGSIALAADGSFSFTVPLTAARNGHDRDDGKRGDRDDRDRRDRDSRDGSERDPRTYSINVTASDAIGNVGSCVAVVTVPHDQRK